MPPVGSLTSSEVVSSRGDDIAPSDEVLAFEFPYPRKEQLRQLKRQRSIQRNPIDVDDTGDDSPTTDTSGQSVPSDDPAANAQHLSAADESACREFGARSVGSPTQPCLLQRESIVVQVVSEEGQPVGDVYVKLINDQQEIVTQTCQRGMASFDGLLLGEYTLTLSSYDSHAWELQSEQPLSHPNSGARAKWQGISDTGTLRVPSVYTVVDGECLTTIAHRFGLSPTTIREHSANAELLKTRPQLWNLVPGDRVELPAHKLKTIRVPTGKRVTLKLVGYPAALRLRVLQSDKPRKNQPYLAQIHGRTLSGRTDQDGNLTIAVYPTDTIAELRVGPVTQASVYMMQLGRLHPVTTTLGVQQRLVHLGFLRWPFTYSETVETQAALRAFQLQHKLPVTGSVDQATLVKLKELYHESLE